MKPQELKVGNFYFHYKDLVLLLSHQLNEDDGYYILNFLRLSNGQVIVGKFSSAFKYNLCSVFS
jgi:hypothetical protein